MNALTRHVFRKSFGLLALVVLCSGNESFAADCEKPPFAAVRQAVVAEHNQEEPTFSSCEPIDGNPASVAALFAYEQPSGMEDVKVFDVELRIADAATGAIQARLTRHKVWESDAYKIDGVAISDKAFPLRAGATIFGVVEFWSASSNVSFYSTSKLSLYERRGKTIAPLMSEFVTDVYQGEGCDVQTTRELRAEPAKGQAYAALRVHEKITGVSRDNQDCPTVDEESDSEVIRHKSGQYPVPKRMRPFSGD